jgi:hypothetical protein
MCLLACLSFSRSRLQAELVLVLPVHRQLTVTKVRSSAAPADPAGWCARRCVPGDPASKREPIG